MTIKILQLNIWGGKFLPEIIDFIKKHDFDVMQLQEVAHGHWIKKFSSDYNFEKINESLKKTHNGILTSNRTFTNQPDSYFGQATVYRKDFVLQNQTIIWFKRFREFTLDDSFFNRSLKIDPRNALSLRLTIANKTIELINTHMMWGPNPSHRAYKMRQGEKLIKYINKLPHPFILTGDFNVVPDTKVMERISELGDNLTTRYKIETTLNPKFTKAPEPYAVDYIIVSPQLKTKSFQLIDKPELSDHYGLMAEVEI